MEPASREAVARKENGVKCGLFAIQSKTECRP